MSQKPPPLGLLANSITSPSKTPQTATDTPSGLGSYGVVARPRFMTNQITSPITSNPSPNNQSKQSFRYRPSRPSLGYIFDNNHQLPQLNDDSSSGASNQSKKKDKSSKKKSKTKKVKNGKKLTKEDMQRMGIRQDRKQSTLASFSQTPNHQTLDAIKRELEFLKKEVPNFDSKYQTALASFHSTGHSKSRQVEFAFIQALSSWIVEDGAPAVKELTEFKQDVQHEMTGLVTTCEELSKQNQQLTIVISDLQQQNEDINKLYSETTKELTKVNTIIKENEYEEETQQLKENDFVDLSKDLEKSNEQNRMLKEKILRLESYLKQTQKDNDDLNNKTYSIENDMQQSKQEILKLKNQITNMEQQHEQELMILAKAHDDYKLQMENEQTQLVQLAQDSQKQIQQMAANMGKPRSGTVVTPLYEEDHQVVGTMADNNGMTLDAEFQQYQFSEDEWLNDSEEEPLPVEPPKPTTIQLDEVVLKNNTINIEPIKEDTPPPFGYNFKLIKENNGISPRDPTKSFKIEKEKRTLELEDITKYFSNERKSYENESIDITKDFTMDHQNYNVEKDDITKEFEMEKETNIVNNKDITMEFEMEKQINDNEIKEKDVSLEFESVKETNNVESNDITKGFTMVKENTGVEINDPSKKWKIEKNLIDVPPIDPEASFVSEKHDFGVEMEDITKKFKNEIQANDLQRADISNTFVMETLSQNYDPPNEKEPFAMETQQQSVEVKEEELAFESQNVSYTPKIETPPPPEPEPEPMSFETGRISIIQDKEPPRPQYAYQIRHLRMDVDAAPARVTKIRKPPPSAHDRPDFGKYYDGKDEIIRKSLAFQKIMAQWKKDEVEKGGKPEILRQKEFELLTKTNMDDELRLKQKSKPAVNKKNGINISSSNSPASPSFEIFSSVTNGNMSQKVTKMRMHKLKPKLNGFITVIRSKFVPKYQLKKEMKFYFCLDGLPSLTNIDKNEIEKNRKQDFLVPCLFFFDKENDYKQLEKEVGALSVRNAIFQKAFSRLAKGIITLHTHACDSSLEKAISQLEILKGKSLNDNEIKFKEKDIKPQTGKSLYIVNDREFHRLEFDDVNIRNEWLHKMHKLVAKRTHSVQKATETYHKQSLGVGGTPIQRAARASSRMSTVNDVENSFD